MESKNSTGLAGRNEKPNSPPDGTKDRLDKLQASFQALLDKEELFAKVIEFFPYPIQIHSPDGVSVMVNKALLEEFDVQDRDLIVGKYNILKDPDIERYGLMDAVKRAFKGETVYRTDLEVPLKTIREFYNTECHNIDAMFQDATVFPILDDDGKVMYVVVILITRRIYRGKESINKAREYLRENWIEDFSLEKTARAANLSPYYFSRLFKKETGTTPHEYYLNIKLERLKEKLCDTSLSISEAFMGCGIDYHGYYGKLFKKKFGITPSQFRKEMGKKNKTNRINPLFKRFFFIKSILPY